VLGSSNNDEATSVNVPKRFFRGFSDTQAIEGIKNIKKLDEVLIRRKLVSKRYGEILKINNKIYIQHKNTLNHSFLKYPILVKNREKFMHKAKRSKVSLGDWFLSPLHPYQGDFSNWYFKAENYPTAVYISKHIVNLPTNPNDIDKVLAFIIDNIDNIK
jgi:dTDP-4-amino-4,6-dideoxygalactose transaminase